MVTFHSRDILNSQPLPVAPREGDYVTVSLEDSSQNFVDLLADTLRNKYRLRLTSVAPSISETGDAISWRLGTL